MDHERREEQEPEKKGRMQRVCCVCHVVYGEIEVAEENPRPTHGYCPQHEAAMCADVDDYLKANPPPPLIVWVKEEASRRGR